jgi:anti-sigma regulatory factor (Ser/Thr protein kinase)
VLRITVRCDRYAPQVVRQALHELPGLECARDDALLVASELVTNAVRHSRCSERELLTVEAFCDEDRLSISVIDPGASGGRAEVVTRAPENGGLGLRVVQELAERWGAERGRDGYTVWAEVALAG